MRIRLTLIISILFIGQSFAQYPSSRLIPYRQGDLWGYADGSKNIVVPCTYRSASLITNGFGVIQSKKGFGIIDSTGKIVVDCHDYLQPFWEPLAAFRNTDKKWGYLNTRGEIKIPAVYDDYSNFRNGLATVKKNGFWGVINAQNQVIVPFEYQDVSINDWQNTIHLKKDNKYGFADSSGKIIVPCIYTYATYMRNHVALVMKGDKHIRVTSTGKEIDTSPYDWTSDFWDGYAILKKGKRYGVIDTSGTIAPGFQFRDIKFFNRDTFIVNNGPHSGILTLRYDTVIPFIYQDIGFSYQATDFIPAKKDGKYGYINLKNQIRIPFRYHEAKMFRNGMARVKEKGWNFIDTSGKSLRIQHRYSFADDFQLGTALVKKSGKWGVIDKTGKEIIPCKFSHWYENEYQMLYRTQNLVMVKKGNRHALYRITGEKITDAVYDNILIYPTRTIIQVEREGHLFYIAPDGEEYYEP